MTKPRQSLKWSSSYPSSSWSWNDRCTAKNFWLDVVSPTSLVSNCVGESFPACGEGCQNHAPLLRLDRKGLNAEKLMGTCKLVFSWLKTAAGSINAINVFLDDQLWSDEDSNPLMSFVSAFRFDWLCIMMQSTLSSNPCITLSARWNNLLAPSGRQENSYNNSPPWHFFCTLL